MYLRKEFQRRLFGLWCVIGRVLQNDSDGEVLSHLNGLLPSLFKVFSYLWSNGSDKLLVKHRSDDGILYPDDLPFPESGLDPDLPY